MSGDSPESYFSDNILDDVVASQNSKSFRTVEVALGPEDSSGSGGFRSPWFDSTGAQRDTGPLLLKPPAGGILFYGPVDEDGYFGGAFSDVDPA